MAKVRMKMLRPRVAMLDTSIAKTLKGTGWRAGKTTNERGYTYAWTQTSVQPIYQAVEYGSAEVIAMLVAELQSVRVELQAVRARLHAVDGL